jgi:hypothetical protein
MLSISIEHSADWTRSAAKAFPNEQRDTLIAIAHQSPRSSTYAPFGGGILRSTNKLPRDTMLKSRRDPIAISPQKALSKRSQTLPDPNTPADLRFLPRAALLHLRPQSLSSLLHELAEDLQASILWDLEHVVL